VSQNNVGEGLDDGHLLIKVWAPSFSVWVAWRKRKGR